MNFQQLKIFVSGEFDKELDRISEVQNLSRADVIRRSVGLYAIALEAESKGETLCFVNNKTGESWAITVNDRASYSKIHEKSEM